MLPQDVQVPAATVRSPAEELATFQLVDGYEARLFAAEPMVQDPVVANFDAAGRLWVCEFTSYMKDIEATDEAEPTGRIVVLHDDDHDGVADRSTVFADGLVLPRAVLPLPDGALVITPPELVFLPDADTDLVWDGPRQVIMGGFEAGTGNPEHSGNGLVWGLDHRIHLANDRRMVVRERDGSFRVEVGAGGGQWGLSHDDRGRFYVNSNSDWLRCDLLPGHYAERAARAGGLVGFSSRLIREQSVWPCRMTPGINRGYQSHMLRDDYVLARTTAVCAPLVYRGNTLPNDGDVFVCEPAGNLVRRFVLEQEDGVMHAVHPYEADQREFLASTDERFRPVHLSQGPDGALYVVDMYRGVIQHRNYVTSFLRDQVERRGLEQPIHKGRIWRIVRRGAPPAAPMPTLLGAEAADLVAALSHDSGTVRDLALQQIVQRDLRAAIPLLRGTLLGDAELPVATRIATLSALQGLGALQRSDFRRELRGRDVGVRTFLLQHAGDVLADADPQVWAVLDGYDATTPPTVLWHAALALGDALASDSPRRDRIVARVYATLAKWLVARPEDEHLLAAAATATFPHVERLLAALAEAVPAGPRAVHGVARELGRRAVRTRDAAVQARLFTSAASMPEWLQAAVLQGAVAALPKGERRTGFLVFAAPPAALTAFASSDRERVRTCAQQLLSAVRVDGDSVPGVVVDLTAAEKQRVADGEVLFRGACASCHQLDGRGQLGLAPPLADSEWVTGPEERLIRIALHGVRGPIEVDGTVYDLEMPGHSHLKDGELASVLSYLRRAFGHRAACVTAETVRTVRNRTKRRASAWTAAELLGND